MSATDLSQKLDALFDAGLTYKAIAKRAGCDISTIFRIRSKQITNPSYSVGVAIDALYAESVKRARKAARLAS